MQKPLELSKRSAEDDDSTSEPTTAGYASVGTKITNWTSNFLATAVVLIIALTVGTQLISSFRWEDEGGLSRTANTELIQAWPVLESCALEFGDLPFQLERESARCDRERVVALLQDKCRQALEQDAIPVGPMTTKETAAIQSLIQKSHTVPIEERKGKWRIFHIETTDGQLNIPLVVGVRDNVDLKNGTPNESDMMGLNSRLVVWGLGMPSESGLASETIPTTDIQSKNSSAEADSDRVVHNWTTFVARSAPESPAHTGRRKLVPLNFDRTLAIANENGTSMIGFKGPEANQAISFYNQLAVSENWEVAVPWCQTSGHWSAQFKPPRESPLQGIQVQLHVKHNAVSGLLFVQSRKPRVD